ncbi:MAG: dihydroorotase, partial [Oscillospiraceae bacterium]
IKNVKIISPEYSNEPIKSILICDGIIKQIADEIEQTDSCEIINGDGLCISPSLVDVHVHFRDPGFEYKEDIISGAKAAAKGGFTDVFTMPNTKPCCDNINVLNYVLNKSNVSKVKIHPIACITKSMAGKELCDFEELAKNGAAGFSDDGKCVDDIFLMQKAAQIANNLKLPIISHCEDMNIVKNGIMNNGRVSRAIGASGIDRKSEDNITQREILISRKFDVPIHIAHVSTSGAITALRRAKSIGVKVTCETAPHYFIFTETKLAKKDANFRMNPPLRERKDVLSMRKAIADGLIDCIATDHAPHSRDEKADFENAPNGIIGLETSFSASYTYLVKKDIISLKQLINLMSVNPAKIMNMPGWENKKVCENCLADLVIYNPNESWVVDEKNFVSKSSNSPFIGMELDLKVKYTIKNGKITYCED